MVEISEIFLRIEKMVKTDSDNDPIKIVFKCEEHTDYYNILDNFITSIIENIDLLAAEIKNNDSILISVKNQKLLRTSFQIITSFGISTCLIPGLGISLKKRFSSAQSFPPLILSDVQKYETLTKCTDFLHRSYEIPVLKNIIITFHLNDYLAALIQLAYAPLKKPGVYSNYIMTEEMYNKYTIERCKYVQIYEYLVANCFQPILMKELLVLQSIGDENPPLFVKKVIAKEMSRRLTMQGGLLSLIRCFIDSPELDTGLQWRKIEMLCKIVSTKHGNVNENDYINNITSQLKLIFSINNSKYLNTAIACFVSLYEKFNEHNQVRNLKNEIFCMLNYDYLLSKSNLPGTIILTSQEVEHKLQVLHNCISMTQLHIPPSLITPNLYVLFLLRLKCTKDVMKSKITDIILKGLELIDKAEVYELIKQSLFGKNKLKTDNISIEEFEAGLTIKHVKIQIDHPKEQALLNFFEIINVTENYKVVNKLFEACLQLLMDLSAMRQNIKKTEVLSSDEPALFSLDDENYAHMLTLLSEISVSQKVINALRSDPFIVINFVESLFLKNMDSECTTIALVLLNTVLSNVNDTNDFKNRLHSLIPKLELLIKDQSEHIKILCNETFSLIKSEFPKVIKSPFDKALSNVFDDLLPVRAHGIIEINKLVDKADPETISKRHLLLCLLQEQLKDTDSYVYLSAINCLASLASHCTSDVLAVLCKEYLNVSIEFNPTETKDSKNQAAELRMKIGDVIVKVTRKLGDMAVMHKTTLLNTMLCASKDGDPLIRASALSNLAEIALVLNYKIRSIIYEVLLCIWSTIETDKAIECRRAAVMVIASLLKGLGKETLIELKDNLLPIYRTLNNLYKDPKEDSIVRLHAQIALEELNDIVKEFLFIGLPLEKEINILKGPPDIVFK